MRVDLAVAGLALHWASCGAAVSVRLCSVVPVVPVVPVAPGVRKRGLPQPAGARLFLAAQAVFAVEFPGAGDVENVGALTQVAFERGEGGRQAHDVLGGLVQRRFA